MEAIPKKDDVVIYDKMGNIGIVQSMEWIIDEESLQKFASNPIYRVITKDFKSLVVKNKKKKYDLNWIQEERIYKRDLIKIGTL